MNTASDELEILTRKALPLGDTPPRRASQTTAAWPQVQTRCIACEATITTWRNPNRAGRDVPPWRPIVRCSSCAAKLFERLRQRAEGRA